MPIVPATLGLVTAYVALPQLVKYCTKITYEQNNKKFVFSEEYSK